jgi:hypothetical protein
MQSIGTQTQTVYKELKRSYYELACRFLGELEFQQQQPTLFSLDSLEVA